MNVSKNISTQSIKANPDVLFLLAGPVFGVGTFSPRLWVHRNVSVVPLAENSNEAEQYAQQIVSRLRTIEDQICRITSGQSEFKSVVICSDLWTLLQKRLRVKDSNDNLCYNPWLLKISEYLGAEISIATLKISCVPPGAEGKDNERASAKVVSLKATPDWKKSA